MQLRPATAADQPWLRGLYASTREQELALIERDTRDAFIVLQFKAQHASYTSRYPAAQQQIIELDGLPVGRLWLHQDTREILVLDISLLPPWRGRGLGTRCLQPLLQQAQGHGQALRLHVMAENPARRLYERLGLSVTGRQGPYLEMTWWTAPATRPLSLETCDEQA